MCGSHSSTCYVVSFILFCYCLLPLLCIYAVLLLSQSQGWETVQGYLDSQTHYPGVPVSLWEIWFSTILVIQTNVCIYVISPAFIQLNIKLFFFVTSFYRCSITVPLMSSLKTLEMTLLMYIFSQPVLYVRQLRQGWFLCAVWFSKAQSTGNQKHLKSAHTLRILFCCPGNKPLINPLL